MSKFAFIILVIICFLLALGAPELARPASKMPLPPHYEQWLRTCRAEQPATLPGYTGNKWKGIAWEQETNYSFKGGCGATQANWDAHKPKGAPKFMSDATPAQQLWFCENIYTHYLRLSGSHRYAATVWDANRNILKWYGFTEETW